MTFLRKFFNDESVVIGLCGFKNLSVPQKQSKSQREVFFNHFEKEKTYVLGYETKFSNNVLLAR